MERTKLIAARLRRHWTIVQAAEHLRVGVNTVIRWEKGQRRPFAYNVQRICEVYQAAAWELDLEDAHHPDAPEVPANIEEQEAAADALKALVRDDLSLRLLKIVWRWPRSNTRYGELQAHIMQKTEDYTTVNQKNDHSINRRDALRLLALLPIEMCGLSALGPVLKYPAEEILTQCAAGITACWYLRQGKELALASSAVTSYIPTLKSIATESTSQGKTAADLLVQCLLLKSYLAGHIEGSNEAIYYAQQAEKYSKLAGNTMHQILALRTLASIHDYANHREQALQVAEKAQYLLEHAQGISIPKLVYSFVYAGIATYEAHNGRKEQAFTALDKAHSTFFLQAVDEQVPIWVNHSHANLLLNDGMTHLHLGLQKDALDTFTQMDGLPVKTESIRYESFLHQVIAEVNRDDKPRDMEWCINLWRQGISGAITLQSERRFNEAVLAYNAMRGAWPGEKAIKDLRELIVHW